MATRKNNKPETAYFVITGALTETIFKGGSYALSLGYTDHAGVIKDNQAPEGQKGRYVEYITAKDEKGRDRAKRFRFDQSLGRFQTRPSDTDIYNKSQYAFLKNHPECEGSPNGIYEKDEFGTLKQVGVTFRELDSVKDAGVALKADRLRNKAETNALNLDDESLIEVAAIIGYFGEADDLLSLKVVEWARKNPGPFISILEDGDRLYKAMIRRALNDGIFSQQGPSIKWQTLIVGNNEAEAIVKIRSDKTILSALQEKLGLGVEETKPKGKKAAD